MDFINYFRPKQMARDYVAYHAEMSCLDIRIAQQKDEMHKLSEDACKEEERLSQEEKINQEKDTELLRSFEESEGDYLQAQKEAYDKIVKKRHTDDRLKKMQREQAKIENHIYELEENLNQSDLIKEFLTIVSPPDLESEDEYHQMFLDCPEKVIELLMFVERDVERDVCNAQKDTTDEEEEEEEEEEYMNNEKKIILVFFLH
ncbi:uncharacterized protein LOC127620647 [Xyrauchen texanus]|uniref:uncharacterized protein LOC127620647 n=1 Tax=Xyrauchen texanus TaxID=154827 RepID=UPI0022421221|nr:uncharacterized protein LOC127620647 [Xyrauchen texanus]